MLFDDEPVNSPVSAEAIDMALEALLEDYGDELTLDPASLPVGRVVELLEGPLQIATCVGDDPQDHTCAASSVCPVKHSVFRIHVRIRDVLYASTIADLAQGSTRASLPVVVSTPEVNA